ncbi:MAG: TetR/AcrR family transcriptional regulator [Clostridiaceae bacterium]
MKQETQTRENLLEVAKKEFMAKGYMGASLRNICKEAGVTTGALYFFFNDKEDLFGSLVAESLNQINIYMKKHYQDELLFFAKSSLDNYDFAEDGEATREIVNYLFQYHDIFTLLLMKSSGSKYENCTDTFVELTQAHYRILADRMTSYYKVERISDYTIHWFSHLQIFSFVQLITHNLTKEEAMKQMDTIVKFLTNGWFGMYKQ